MIMMYYTQNGKAIPLDRIIAEELAIVHRDKKRLDELVRMRKYGRTFADLKMKIGDAEDRIENYERILAESGLTISDVLPKPRETGNQFEKL